MSALPIAGPDDREAPAGLSSVVVPAVSAENLVRRYGEGSMAVRLVFERLQAREIAGADPVRIEAPGGRALAQTPIS